MVRATINGKVVEVEKGTTILDAANQVQVKIPTLCKHPDLISSAACGICIVKVKGSNKMLRACCTPLDNAMEIITHDPEIVSIRRTVLELILSKHPNDCLKCGRNNNCELQRLAADFGVHGQPVEIESTLLDRHIRWRAAGNIWHNSAIRTTLYLPIHGLRRLFGGGRSKTKPNG